MKKLTLDDFTLEDAKSHPWPQYLYTFFFTFLKKSKKGSSLPDFRLSR